MTSKPVTKRSCQPRIRFSDHHPRALAPPAPQKGLQNRTLQLPQEDADTSAHVGPKLLTFPQLFRYEHAQRSDNRHLLGVETLKIDFPDKVFTRGHHHFNEGQGVQHSRQQHVVIIRKVAQRALPTVLQLAVKKGHDKYANVVWSRAVSQAVSQNRQQGLAVEFDIARQSAQDMPPFGDQ
jgi:hypothetical protein